MTNFVDVIQGSAEWLKIRSGRITASRMSDVLARPKKGNGELKSRADYRLDLIAERLTGRAEETFVSNDMKWGTAHEKGAREKYEEKFREGEPVDLIGFAIHPEMDFSGASPDALVGSDGGVEIKCPKTTTHLTYMLAGVVPEEYKHQMYWNMVCCERKWWDFISYDPRLPDDLQLFCACLPFDREIANMMEAEVRKFNDEIEDQIRKLYNSSYGKDFPEEF